MHREKPIHEIMENLDDATIELMNNLTEEEVDRRIKRVSDAAQQVLDILERNKLKGSNGNNR
jgi:hypothetical protein